MRKRFRELGNEIGELTPGWMNAITDVAGVLVGQTSIIEGDGLLVPGRGPVRTGVTVILPHGDNLFEQKVPAAVFTINGYGKATGFEQVRELGTIEAPIALTNTLNVGRVMDALVSYEIRENPGIGIHTNTINVVVGETNDGYLNDIQGRHVREEHVWAAIAAAANGPVEEGSVGAGTGTRCYGWKGGIGTASRILPGASGGFIVGALVQTNFGRRQDLMIKGIPIGRRLGDTPTLESVETGDKGSVMIVLATDAPLESRQLQRLASRANAGLARTGSMFGSESGDFVIAFSTAYRIFRNRPEMIVSRPGLGNEARLMDVLFRAVIECVEEAALDSLFCAETVVGRDGHTAVALPVDHVLDCLEKKVKKNERSTSDLFDGAGGAHISTDQ
jgi:D-aminopeptidase